VKRWGCGLAVAAIAVALGGCGDTGGSESEAVPKVSPKARRAAANYIERQDRRELRLLKDAHMVGPPEAQTIKAKCPASGAKVTSNGGYSLRCTATLYLAAAPGIEIMDEAWRVKWNAQGRFGGAKPVEGYEIRSFFEADNLQDCSGALAAEVLRGSAAELQGAVDALAPCIP
jgi:hypothetical protein